MVRQVLKGNVERVVHPEDKVMLSSFNNFCLPV